jgi:hypothetical protein
MGSAEDNGADTERDMSCCEKAAFEARSTAQARVPLHRYLSECQSDWKERTAQLSVDEWPLSVCCRQRANECVCGQYTLREGAPIGNVRRYVSNRQDYLHIQLSTPTRQGHRAEDARHSGGGGQSRRLRANCGLLRVLNQVSPGGKWPIPARAFLPDLQAADDGRPVGRRLEFSIGPMRASGKAGVESTSGRSRTSSSGLVKTNQEEQCHGQAAEGHLLSALAELAFSMGTDGRCGGRHNRNRRSPMTPDRIEDTAV